MQRAYYAEQADSEDSQSSFQDLLIVESIQVSYQEMKLKFFKNLSITLCRFNELEYTIQTLSIPTLIFSCPVPENEDSESIDALQAPKEGIPQVACNIYSFLHVFFQYLPFSQH